MKHFAIALCLLLSAFAVNAQPPMFHPEQLSDEEILQMQIRDMVMWLNLEGEAKTLFAEEYSDFRKEIDAVAKNANPPQIIDNEDDIDKAIQNNFKVSEQILQIRKKYYLRFKKFMKPSQIQRMFQLENESGRRMQQRPQGSEFQQRPPMEPPMQGPMDAPIGPPPVRP